MVILLTLFLLNAVGTELSPRARLTLKASVGLCPDVLSKQTRESLTKLKGMGPCRVAETEAYLEAAGFQLGSRVPTSNSFQRLSGRAKSVLERLGYPSAAQLVAEHTRCSLQRMALVGPVVLQELTKYAMADGCVLCDSEFAKLSVRAQVVHSNLGFPSIETMVKTFSRKTLLDIPGVARNIRGEFESIAAENGLAFRPR